MEKIIIYGLGMAFEQNREFLERKFKVVGYCDKRECAIRTIAPDEIYRHAFDYILVSSTKYINEIREELVIKYNIPKDTILSLYEWYLKKANLYMNDCRKTSMTDNGIYPAVCFLASQDAGEFEVFRRNPIIIQTYEHVSRSVGQEYLDVIEQNYEVVFSESDWLDFAKNDLYGLPKKYSYRILGKDLELSPTTIRYVKVMQDILSLFDVEKIKSIVEIGIGYGGQCRIISSKCTGGGVFVG